MFVILPYEMMQEKNIWDYMRKFFIQNWHLVEINNQGGWTKMLTCIHLAAFCRYLCCSIPVIGKSIAVGSFYSILLCLYCSVTFFIM